MVTKPSLTSSASHLELLCAEAYVATRSLTVPMLQHLVHLRDVLALALVKAGEAVVNASRTTMGQAVRYRAWSRSEMARETRSNPHTIGKVGQMHE
jgi:hypothetical protein